MSERIQYFYIVIYKHVQPSRDINNEQTKLIVTETTRTLIHAKYTQRQFLTLVVNSVPILVTDGFLPITLRHLNYGSRHCDLPLASLLLPATCLL